MASADGHAPPSASPTLPTSSDPRRPAPEAVIEHIRTHDRLSTPFPLRLPLAMALSSFAGFALGTFHGSSEAGLRFRAENAHRFPTSQAGWYLYHKSKNYHMALGGIYEGMRMAARQAAWVGVFVGMEECIDRGRAGVVRMWREVKGTAAEEKLVAGNRDFVSTVLAGLGTAGAFSAWHHFPVPTTARVAKLGAKVGLAYGILQDIAGALRGRRLGYVEFIKRHTVGSQEEETPAQPVAVAAG